MLASEFITELRRLKDRHGDLPVVGPFTKDFDNVDWTIEFNNDQGTVIMIECNDGETHSG